MQIQTFKTTRIITTFAIVLMSLFCFAKNSHASVIFSDNFEWGSDWNSSMDDTAPKANGWGGLLVSNFGGSYEGMYVNAAGAKNGSRGMIQYWDSGGASTQENWLLHGGGNGGDLVFPNEYYIGYWIKVDPNWDWGNASRFKIIKTNFNDGSTWDIFWNKGYAAYCCGDAIPLNEIDDWCTIDGTRWTGDSNCVASISTDEAAYAMYGCWNAIDDGQWHYFVWHMNHSSNALALSIDGADAFQMSSDQWPPASGFSTGVNGGITGRWQFGGNLTAGGGGVNEMWTAYDDVVIATTKAEVDNFLGVSGDSDVTAPTNPSGLSVS